MTIRRDSAIRTLTAALASAGHAMQPANRRALERLRDQLAAGDVVGKPKPAAVRVEGRLGALRTARGYG